MTFKSRLTSPLPTTRDMWRILREGGFRPKDAVEQGKSVPVLRGPLPQLGPDQASITWIGHATNLVRFGSTAILTDPVWSLRLPGFIPRLSPPGVPFEDLPPIAAAVVSHNHYDHLDDATARRLRGTQFLVPLGLERWFRKRGLEAQELDWHESATVAGVRFTLVPCHHWSRRGLGDTCKTLWGAWVMERGGRKLFFGGDTAYGHHFRDVGARYGPFDVAMMPIGAYEPRWFMANVHMDPSEAVQATQDLGARRMATMHWGTFPLTREPILEPPQRAREAWAAAGRPRDALWDLAIGETRRL